MNWGDDYVVDYTPENHGIPAPRAALLYRHKTMSTRLAWLSLTRF